jgi:hypothetical protein
VDSNDLQDIHGNTSYMGQKRGKEQRNDKTYLGP